MYVFCLVRGSGVGVSGCEDWSWAFFTKRVGTWGVWDMCMCLVCGGVSGVTGGGVDWARVLEGVVVLCMCVL